MNRENRKVLSRSFNCEPSVPVETAGSDIEEAGDSDYI